jgi:hypothetical protein
LGCVSVGSYNHQAATEAVPHLAPPRVASRLSPFPKQSAPFALLPDGRRVDKVTLSNEAGVSVELLTYGATVTSVKVRG